MSDGDEFVEPELVGEPPAAVEAELRREAWRLKAWLGLVHDAVDATTDLVGDGHESAARLAMRITDRLGPLAGPARVVDGVRWASTRGTLATVRGVNRAVEQLLGLGLGLAPDGTVGPVPLRSDVLMRPALVEDAALGLVNGLLGERLEGRRAGLGFRLRSGDAYLPPVPSARGDAPALVVLVHGLAATEWSWCLDAEAYHGDAGAHFGRFLHDDFGLEPVFARYNSGRPIEHNGAALADRLRALTQAWSPSRLVLLGHSMGGLVALEACRIAERRGDAWLAATSDLVSLGSPHRGAPLAVLAELGARASGAIDLPATAVIQKILDVRSAGIRDLEHGGPGAWEEDLPAGMRFAFLSSTARGDGTAAQLVGDLLVPAPSAHGPRHVRGEFANRLVTGVLHHQLQCHPDAYAAVVEALRR